MGNTFSSAKPAWLAAAAADPSLPLARDPAEFEDGAAVLFLIDVTGSMGQWIAAVNAALPSLVHSVAITDIFGKMAILEYSDYDQPVDRVCGFSGWRVTSKADDVAALAAFAKAMTPRGGGGAPEAFKTSLYQLVAEAREVSNLSRVHVLHLTDAPPHCLPTLDAEGKKENAALGEGFAWHSVVLKLLSHVPTLRYTVLSSCNHALYCDLAARTGGSAHLLQGQVSASVIREEISHIMNGWLGLPGAHSHQFVLRTPIDVNVAPPADEAELIARGVTNVTQPMDACRVVKARMNVALTRLRKDALYRVPLLNALGQILDLDPMALTVSPVVGKLWREMCKMRSDERRDELIERLSKRKADLARGDREALDKWLRESYDAKAEIEEQLREWMQRNDTRGLLRFVPEDESLCAQQVVQLLARNDKQSTTIIRAILSRMLRDESTVIPRIVDDADRGTGNTHADPTQGIDGDWKIPDSLLSARPHFRSAIVVLLPDDVAARVNELREGNDTGYPRWMPHITIAFPFLPPDVFAAAIPAIATLLQGKTAEGAVPKPFQLTLAEVGCFPGAKAVLHLKPEVSAKAPNGKGALEALHDLIMQAFPQVVRADRSSFEAHVTLGQCAGGKAAEARAEEIKRQWKPASFTVSQFHLIVHRDDEPTYVVEHSFDLPASVPSAGAVRRRAPAVASDDMDEAPPLPLQAGTIPLNMNPEQVMMLAMHTVAPGTKLSRRYAALLAMHATLCGSVLSPVAREFLLAVRGKWINWRRRESDNAPEVPENFAPSFVNLLLNPAFADVVTEEEAAFATFLQRISLALRFYHTEVTVQTIDGTSADGKFPDHTMVCESCNKERPLSIMSAEGKCGYCVENRADAVPACDPEKQLQVRCYTCGAFYARNGAVNIPGHSKCHGCHRLGKPSTAIECRVCHLKVVQHYNVEAGLPKHGVCGPCAHQCPPRKLSLKDHVAPVHQLMPAEAFTRLCATVGLGPVEGAATLELFSVGICDAVLRVRAIEPLPAATTDDIALTFRNATPVNAASILDEIQKIMAGTAQPQRAECALCLRDDVPLGPACGRRGCDQRVCRACAVAWYGKNEPGRKLYERALLCQFCARAPAPHVLRGVAPRLLGVSNRARGMHLDPQAFHGWCGRCDAIEEIGNRDCAELGGGDAADGVENFLCRACTTARDGHVVAATAGAKECPGCTVMVEKVDGCDHITCTNCSQHWCWQCRAAFGTADETYDHMYTVHVGDDDDEADE